MIEQMKSEHIACCTCQECSNDILDKCKAKLKAKDEEIKKLYKLLCEYGWMGEPLEE